MVKVSSLSFLEIPPCRHLISQIELMNAQLDEIDKKIEEFSVKTNSPIISIPGISHFSGTSILSELGDIFNYSKPSQIIKVRLPLPSISKHLRILLISAWAILSALPKVFRIFM